jgi:hypothetical protein
MHTAFKFPYVYDYITKLCSIGEGEARYRKSMRLKLGGGQAYDRSSD